MKIKKNIQIYKSKLKLLFGGFSKYFDWTFYPKYSIDRYFYKNNEKRYKKYSKKDKFINLGAGRSFFHPRWECLDFYKDGMNKVHENYINWDFSEKKDLPDKYSLAYCSHVIEHIPKHETNYFLQIIHKALKKDGILRLVLPDADLFYEAYLQKRYDFFELFESKINFPIEDSQKLDYLFIHLMATPKSYKKAFNKGKYELSKIREKLEKLNKEEFLDYLIEDINENSLIGHEHINWFNYEKLEKKLKQAGFKEIYRSGFGQSRTAPMREIPLFDGTLPCFSLYVEAVK